MMPEKRKLTYIVLAIMTVFLMVGRFLIIELGILAILFLFGFSRKNRMMYIGPLEKSIALIAAFTAFDILLSVVPGYSALISFQESITEIERAVFYFLIIQIISKVKLDIRSYLRIWRLILIVVVGICIIQYLKPFDIDTYLKRFYGDTVQFLNSAKTDLDSFRGGSVFVNPNFMACFLTGYFANYLVLIKKTSDHFIIKILNFVLVIVGLILSGSRTGLMIAGIELLLFFMQNSKAKRKVVLVRLLGSFAVILALFSIFFTGSLPASSGLRAFQLNEGVNSSLSVKFYLWRTVMSQAHIGNYLFGFGPINYAADPKLLVDFELGYFTVFYGLAGIFLYIGLGYSIIKQSRRYLNTVIQRRRNLYFVLVMVLFGFTSGVYLNLRMFSVFIVLFLPTIINVAGDSDEQIRST